MAFLNTRDAIIIDKDGNIYNFKLIKDGIELIIHTKATGEAERALIVNGEIIEYDVTINEEDGIDLICKKKDKSLSIYSLNKGEWIESKIYEKGSRDTCGLKIMSLDKKIHIFYYMMSLEDNTKLSIYHHYLKDSNWETSIVKDICKSDIIKPIEVIKDDDSILIGYYDLGKYSEDIFISRFDKENGLWEDAINITNDNKFKLYLDLLKIDDFLHITYSEYEGENLIIKHKKIKLKLDGYIEVTENILSSPANCTYPTLILNGDLLWNVWTEYESVVSSYSKDRGETWSSPYIWSKSKEGDFARFRFNNSQEEVRDNYDMNYSFSKLYPDLLLLGFGELNQAVKSVKKKEDFNKEIKNQKIEKFEQDLEKKSSDLSWRINQLEKEIIELKRILRNMDTKIKNIEISSLERRLGDIENYIYRRRSPFSPRT